MNVTTCNFQFPLEKNKKTVMAVKIITQKM